MSSYVLIDSYKFPDNIEEWRTCPNCGLKPKIWIFDNGASTGCGCGKTKYDHFSINTESINSRLCRGAELVSTEEVLKKNWNTWCETGKILFELDYQKDGRW